MVMDQTTPLAFRHLKHQLLDPEEFGIAMSGAQLAADFLDAVGGPTLVEQFQTPGWMLDVHEAHVKARVICPIPPGWVSLGLMRNAAGSTWYGIPAGHGTLVCNPPGVPIDGCITPGFTCAAITVPTPFWERCTMLADVEPDELNGLRMLRFSPPQMAWIEAGLERILCLLRRPGKVTSWAVAETGAFFTQLITSACEIDPPDPWSQTSQRNRARLARRAEEWMRDHLSEPVQVPDVCLALRVSRRELEYAFRGAFDQSPRNHLHALRLNALRRALQRGAVTSVTQAAMDHGITHLGRLGTQYRRLFGESPRATLGK
ncbi:MAG: AraC family transcriptional regulator [Verrucomicrobiales bacterium]|nr:AraC family transcriptional regulator [Verrucomicrobiales bacterium]